MAAAAAPGDAHAVTPQTPSGSKPTPGSERDFTAALARFLPARDDVVVGIGDDAAVVRNQKGRSVMCCDPVIAGVHFAAAAPLRLVGRKAINRNLADLAAMGAVPDHLLVSVVFPPGFPSRSQRQLFLGLRAAAAAANCVIVGGDVAVGPGPLVVTTTAIGHLPGRALLRSGARVGDTLHVTGPLGGSIAGHHLRFSPPLAEGVWLAGQRRVHAAMDVSDGLVLDLHTLLQASGCAGAELDAGAVPIRAAARRLAQSGGATALQRALGDGEDHVLLWSQAAGELAAGGPLTHRARRPIGRVLDVAGLWLRHADGRRERLLVRGFEHDLTGAHRPPSARSGRHRAPR
ncbi:MAG: thiamine-phosphate kinase [Planctomycetes bacterium]|nr:thiamine-phosphate kinase [Planctomycetota bacterium]